jgi:hypothetical protein
MPIVGTYKGSKNLAGMYIKNDITTEEVINGINLVRNMYPKLVSEMEINRHKYDWLNVCTNLEKKYKAVKQFQNFDSQTIRNKYIETYNNLYTYD